MKPTWLELIAVVLIFICMADFAPAPPPLCVQGARKAFYEAYFARDARDIRCERLCGDRNDRRGDQTVGLAVRGESRRGRSR
jgi:hypothetical protein